MNAAEELELIARQKDIESFLLDAVSRQMVLEFAREEITKYKRRGWTWRRYRDWLLSVTETNRTWLPDLQRIWEEEK